MILTVSCDVCGKVMDPKDAHGDYDDIHYCELDWTKHQLRAATEAYAQKLEWLESTHLKSLREQEAKIATLKTKLSLLENNHVGQ